MAGIGDMISSLLLGVKQNFPLLFPSEMEKIAAMPQQQRQVMAAQGVGDLVAGMPVIRDAPLSALSKLYKGIQKRKDLGSMLLTDIIQKDIYSLQKGSNYKKLYFADDAGNILGGASISEGPKKIYLDQLAVHPKASGGGIGTEIMNALIADAKTRNKKIITFPAKTGVEKFYEKFGFVKKSSDRWEYKP